MKIFCASITGPVILTRYIIWPERIAPARKIKLIKTTVRNLSRLKFSLDFGCQMALKKVALTLILSLINIFKLRHFIIHSVFIKLLLNPKENHNNKLG